MSDLLDARVGGRSTSGGGVGDAVVSAGCPEAAATGSAVLIAGGNAVDAAIAASAVQCVRELPWCGLGGDGFALVSGPDGELESLNGAGAVPRTLATVEIPGGLLPRFGPLSVSTPGLVDAWSRLLERYGTRPLADLLEPAAELADTGFELDEAFARALSRTRLGVGHQDPFYFEFCDNNGAEPGERFRLPTLARTLRLIGAHGPEIFYAGSLGKTVVGTILERGGLVSEADFANHSVDFEPPITVGYGSAQVAVTPPVSMGWVLLQQMLLYEALGGREVDDEADRIDLMVRCKHAAFSDLAGLPRRQDTADVVPVLAPDSIDRWCSIIARQRQVQEAPLPAAARQAEGTDTTCLSVADSKGLMVTFIHSLFNEFGSRVVVPGTGIVLNDRLAKQSTSLGHADGPPGSRRPLHTLVAYHVRDADRRFTGATPGGRGQVQTNFQVLRSIIDDGASPADAIMGPRWLSGAPRLRNADDLLFLEPEFPVGLATELQQRGHQVASGDGQAASDMFGSCTLAGVSSDCASTFGAADRRRGAALAIIDAAPD